MPATTPDLRAVKSATIFSSPDTVATDVMSWPPCRSSARALLIKSRSIIFQPPDSRLSNIQLDPLAARCAFSIDHLSQGNLHASENHGSLGE